MCPRWQRRYTVFESLTSPRVSFASATLTRWLFSYKRKWRRTWNVLRHRVECVQRVFLMHIRHNRPVQIYDGVTCVMTTETWVSQTSLWDLIDPIPTPSHPHSPTPTWLTWRTCCAHAQWACKQWERTSYIVALWNRRVQLGMIVVVCLAVSAAGPSTAG